MSYPAAGQLRYVVITPVRDEALYVQKTVESMARQTLPPCRWIVVDDGSTDGTGELLDRLAEGIPWMTVVHRRDRGFRAAGGGVMDAFLAGYSALGDEPWDFIVKLDGDLSFEPRYFEECFSRFAEDTTLGVGGGTVCKITEGRVEIDSAGDPPFHVRGATKIYRLDCWRDIGLPVKAPGWDTIDEVKANLKGWKTRTFAELQLIQHKPTGAAAGCWANAFKNGRANYITGYHPLFMLAKVARRVFHKPLSIEAAALMAGFCSGYLRRLPQQADAETVRYIRAQQVRRLLLRPSIYDHAGS